MVGPETLYVLDVYVPLEYLELNFGAAADMRLFLLSGDGAFNCLAVAGMNGPVMVPNLVPDRYYLVADGYTAGAYFFSIHCQVAGPSATPTATPTVTATPTRTRTPTPITGRKLYLPLITSRFHPVQSWYWAWLENTGW